MLITHFIYLIALFYLPLNEKYVRTDEPLCISQEEHQLYTLINDYRQQNKLPAIPLSISLTRVSQAHVRDLTDNYKPNNRCNPHSWSRKGDWSPCCYTPNHKSATCMWDKPREIASYRSNGYEIVYWHSEQVDPIEALNEWGKSPGHNPLLINNGQWAQVEWKAIGVGIYNQYAVVWFGEKEDTKHPPEICHQ